jgi:hypothetical protein
MHQAARECQEQMQVDEEGKINFIEFKRWYEAQFELQVRSYILGNPLLSTDAVQADDGELSISFPKAVYCYLHSIDDHGISNYINSRGLNPSIRKAHGDTFVGFVVEIRQGNGFLRMIRRFSQLRKFVDQLRAALPTYKFPMGFPPMRLVEVCTASGFNLQPTCLAQPDPNIRRGQLEQFFTELLKVRGMSDIVVRRIQVTLTSILAGFCDSPAPPVPLFLSQRRRTKFG